MNYPLQPGFQSMIKDSTNCNNDFNGNRKSLYGSRLWIKEISKGKSLEGRYKQKNSVKKRQPNQLYTCILIKRDTAAAVTSEDDNSILHSREKNLMHEFFERRTSVYCVLLYCASQKLHFLQIEDLQ